MIRVTAFAYSACDDAHVACVQCRGALVPVRVAALDLMRLRTQEEMRRHLRARLAVALWCVTPWALLAGDNEGAKP